VTHDDVVWLAGLLEGEGCFGLTRNVRGFGTAYVSLLMGDFDVVERAANLIQAPSVTTVMPKHAGWSRMYGCRVTGPPAIKLMQEMLPYMGERRTDKIHDLIDYMAEKPEQDRFSNTSRKGQPKLTAEQATYILTSDERSVDLAYKFDVTTHTINNVRSGRTWSHVLVEVPAQ